MPKIRLLAVLNTEKITKNQPVVSGHAPCIVICQKLEMWIYPGGKSTSMMKSPDDLNFSPIEQWEDPVHGHFVLLSDFTKELKK